LSNEYEVHTPAPEASSKRPPSPTATVVFLRDLQRRREREKRPKTGPIATREEHEGVSCRAFQFSTKSFQGTLSLSGDFS
jgi:hypothetical protein